MRLHSPTVLIAGLLLAGISPGVFAHPGHIHTAEQLNSPLIFGLLHPLGLDHLLTCLAAGIWGAIALPLARQWLVPVFYGLLFIAGSFVSIGGFGLLGAAHGVGAGPVLGVGLLALLLASSGQSESRLRIALGSLFVGGLGLTHGAMHGFEFSGGGQIAYCAGFGVTSSALMVAGLSATFVCRSIYEQSTERRLKCQPLHPTN